jgi:secondary thiamine-phosphate synthase enzyme
MRQAADILRFQTPCRGLTDITHVIVEWVAKQGMSDGLLTVFCRHTSASLLIQENASPEVRSDIVTFFARLVPEGPDLYAHDDEGPDDMPSHIRTALTQVQLSVPVIGTRPALGLW